MTELTNEQVSWSSRLVFDADIALSVVRVEGDPVIIRMVNSNAGRRHL